MWKRAWSAFGVTGVAVNFGYGVSKGAAGEHFTPQDAFNPPETLGKVVGRKIHADNTLLQNRARGEDELHTVRMKNATPQFTTNIRQPPVFSEEVDKRIRQGAQELYK